MKNQDLQKKTDQLMDAIGGIDDLFLNEAMNWQELSVRRSQKDVTPEKKTRKSPIRALLIAASLVLVMVIGMSAMVSAFMRSSKGVQAPNKDPDVSQSSANGSRLDTLLSECVQSSSFTTCTGEKIPCFDGTVRVMVEDRSTGELFVSRPLNEAEQKSVQREMKVVGERVAPNPESDATSSAYSVWVTLGDGTVLTPCLNPSHGNLGAGTLFDYESERVPTQIFMDLLSALK